MQSIKSILVAVTEDGSEETPSALAYALSLANRTRAHVTVLAVSLELVVLHAAISPTIKNLANRENRRRETFSKFIAEQAQRASSLAGVSCSVECEHMSYAEFIQIFTARARVHDLSILDAEAYSMDVDRGLITAAIYRTGRPVIIVPQSWTEFRNKRCVVAWDGSVPATRAVNDALPLLHGAESVEILSLGKEKELAHTVPGAELAPHLCRHGLVVTVKDVATNGRSVAEALRQEGRTSKADLLVLGAYGHSGFREFLLGGVTRSLLQQSEVPLFLSH